MLGAAAVISYAPFGFFLGPVLTLAGLYWLITREISLKRSALVSFCYGCGLFLAGVSWIYVSLERYGGMAVPLALAATFAFCAGLALFMGICGIGYAKLRRVGELRNAFLFAALWTLSEWLRGTIFGGFPWLVIGYSQVPFSPLAGYTPLLGVYGVTFMVALSAALSVLALAGPRRATAVTLLVMLWLEGWALRQVQWTSPIAQPFTVALLQGNIAQDRKWREDERARTLDTYLSLLDRSDASLLVMPETALPVWFDALPADFLRTLRERIEQRRSTLIVGAPERVEEHDQVRYFNSAFALGGAGAEVYRKRHLVLLGEYVPAGSIFRSLSEVLHIPLNGFSPGPANPAPMIVDGQRVAISICFEDAFGEQIVGRTLDATLLVNLSNLAWFGDSLAPHQHLQISQTRALESGRFVVRATNTGVTAIIDQRGYLTARAPQFEPSVLHGTVQGYTGRTPYALWGNAPIVAFASTIILGVIVGMSRSGAQGGRLHQKCLPTQRTRGEALNRTHTARQRSWRIRGRPR